MSSIIVRVVKEYTSGFLRFIAVSLMGFPLLYPLSVAILFDTPFGEVFALYGSPFFYLASFWMIVSGWGLWEMKRWAWYVFLVAMSLVAGLNISVVINYSHTQHPFFATLSSLFAVLLNIYLVAREVRVPYFLPRIPWWKAESDFRVELPVRVGRPHDTLVLGQIMDLSHSGCFIRLNQEEIEGLGPIDAEDEVMMKFQLFGEPLEVKGNIVWVTQGGVTHPRGLGVKFYGVSKSEKNLLSISSKRLRKIANADEDTHGEGFKVRLKDANSEGEDHLE